MAKIYARYAAFAPLKTRASEDGKTPAVYDAGGFIGKLMNISVTPTLAKAELPGDDEVAESISEVVSAAISLGTTAMPWDIGAKMFGYEVKNQDDKTEIINKIDDESAVGALGYCYGEILNGVKHYYTVILPETTFDLPADSVTTRGTSITFSTPTISGTARPDLTGEWRHTYEFASFKEAKAKLKELLNITDAVTQTAEVNNN